MLRKFYLFFCGYLRLKVEGPYLEAVFNRLMRRGVVLWNIEQKTGEYYVNIKEGDFEKYRELLKENGCRVEIIASKGLPAIKTRLLSRRGLIIGAVLFLVVIYGLSQFVVMIEIKGLEEVEEGDIYSLLKEQEVNRGILKSRVSKDELERLIVQSKEKIGWANIYFQGVKLVVELEEKDLIETVESCDVVAKKSGIITELIPLRGTPQVEEGMPVAEGDKLISRYVKEVEEGEEGEEIVTKKREVKAAGIVKARVWHQGYGEAKLTKHYQQPTGNSATSLILKYRNQERVISGPKTPPYSNFEVKEEVKSLPEWRNYSLPVEIIIRRYIQLQEVKEQRSMEEARDLARRKALNNILQRLEKEPIILNSQFDLIEANLEENLVRIKALVEVEEDIAIRRE